MLNWVNTKREILKSLHYYMLINQKLLLLQVLVNLAAQEGHYSSGRAFCCAERSAPAERRLPQPHFSARILAAWMPLAEAWDREWVTPEPSPNAYRPGIFVSRFLST